MSLSYTDYSYHRDYLKRNEHGVLVFSRSVWRYRVESSELFSKLLARVPHVSPRKNNGFFVRWPV